MNLVLTGGGTGGHIYPALEVGRFAAENGASLRYFGSNRGQERQLAEANDIEFQGFDGEPIYSLKTPAGWMSAIKLLWGSAKAKSALRKQRPDVIFSTGGYGAAPVVMAARALRIPYVIHESNSMPGRVNVMFMEAAAAVTCAFEHTKIAMPKADRTGQPIRKDLRDAANRIKAQPDSARNIILGLGGSQGSAFLNEALLNAAPLLPDSVQVLVATGPNNFIDVSKAPPNFKGVFYLQLADLVEGYTHTIVAVGRSGGTVAEFAMFGLPSVLIPLPTAYRNHQLENAKEMERIGGAVILEQTRANGKNLAEAVNGWLNNQARRDRAKAALQAWDVPDASERIFAKLKAAASN